GELRRDVPLKLLELRIRIRAGEVGEDVGRALEQLAGPLHRFYGIGEGRRCGAVRDRLHFSKPLRAAFLACGKEVSVGDLVERWRLKRQRAGFEKWVHALGLNWNLHDYRGKGGQRKRP